MVSNFDNEETDDVQEKRNEVANAFGTDADPLSQYIETFESLDVDPLQMYIEDVISRQSLSQSRQNDFQRIYRQYREFMENRGRPPACPTADDLRRFAIYQLTERDKKVDQVKAELRMIERAYEYWQESSEWPHPTEYNPIDLARDKTGFKEFRDQEDDKEVRMLSKEEIRERIRSVKNVRDQAIIGSQFKLLARVGAITEMRLPDIDIQHGDLQDHYPSLGTHPYLDDYENAVVIPDKDSRDRNKSANARILPIDDELRRLLIRYLLVRPDADEPYVFLSQERNDQLWPKRINQAWKEAFHPEFSETERYKPITSHYGRHFGSTFWRIHEQVPRELVEYMRGDEVEETQDREKSIDTYLHAKYNDIDELYRENVFKFGLHL